jgi:hypothetical protein
MNTGVKRHGGHRRPIPPKRTKQRGKNNGDVVLDVKNISLSFGGVKL